MIKRALFLLVCVSIYSANSHAFNPKKTATDLRGSSVNSIYQDNKGLIWLGTNAGMSTYDGKNTTLINDFKGVTKINGTVNDDIMTETLYGLKLLNPKNGSTTTFERFNNAAFSTSDKKGTLFIVQTNGSVYYKRYSQSDFDNLIITDLISTNIKAFFVDNSNTLRIITGNGTLRSFDILDEDGTVRLEEKAAFQLSSDILFCFMSDNRIYIINNEYKLSEYRLETHLYSFITDLKSLLADKGTITSGLFFKNEFYIGTEEGLFVIRNNNAVKIRIKTGITCLLKDKFQDLIWIGTSGDGVYTYSYDLYTIKSNLLSDFSPDISTSVTAIYHNTSANLWLGTEGDGIIVIPNYNPDNKIGSIRTLSTGNGLPDNTVYSLQRSEHGIWIGCKSGLAFYSNEYKTISKINDVSLKNVWAVYEQDSVLWVACYGKGIVKATIAYKNNRPEIINTESYVVSKGEASLNRFSSIYPYSGMLWFINTGNGIFRLTDNKLIKFEFAETKYNSINHMSAINKTNYITSTDFGTVRVNLDDQRIDTERVLNNISTNNIIPGYWNEYWLSTDNGLALYNTEFNTFRYFDKSYGLTVTEYCNGSSFKDEQSNVLFFGGINGFTTVKYNDYDEAMDYMPGLYLEKLSIFGIDRNLSDYDPENSGKLTFKPDENFFAVTFNALDYVNGNNYTFYYKIGKNGQWVDNGNSGIIWLTDITPGKYDLFVKYYNKMLNKESYTHKLSITVLSPWYRSGYAYSIYSLTSLLIVYLITSLVVKRRQQQQEEERLKAEQQQKEKMHEAKLNFFTDIAHEFCTPLTLISGPCKLILEQKNISPSVAGYANVINRNAKRMNSLINNLMDFKQMESGYKQPEITRLNVSEIADRVTSAFIINTSGLKIDIIKQYTVGIEWNSDEEFLTTILINLLSNAVKYTDGEPINIEISIKNDHLAIKVINKGKAINKEHIADIFNRFTVSDNYVEQDSWRQNGLGLAITASMVKLLSGNILVDSTDNLTSFIVELPFGETDAIESNKKYDLSNNIISGFISPQTKYEYKDDRPTVAIIDDNQEMLWFICNILNGEFNVLPINDSSTAIESLAKNHTDIILCDVMMNGIDGITLTETLKSDKNTSHIPLIIISADHDIETQNKAINAGAELYITKPFDNVYLKATIKRLLGRKEDLKDYFASPLSAYELNMGKLEHSEHRKFLKKIFGIINKNIQNENLSPEFIASGLGMSTRSLYRKVNEATDKGLLEIIRDGKLAVAENLLLKSKFSIDEIIFKSGFSSRASFYRAFTKKNDCSPTEFIDKNNIQ